MKNTCIRIVLLAISGLIVVAGIKSFGPNLFYKKFRQAEGCIQVISPARNILTGQCQEFPTSCEIPFYYKQDKTCSTEPSSVAKTIDFPPATRGFFV